MFTKLIRLGRDAEIFTTPTGKSVCEFTGAYDVGFGQNKTTQWVKCSLWGDRGGKVVQYLVKGSQVVVTLDDVKAGAYLNKKNNEPMGTLEGRVVAFDFADNRKEGSQPAPAPVQQAQQPPAPGFDDEWDDPIPF